MRIEYNEELRMIKDEILMMSAMTEKMLADSVQALKSQDCELARSVIERDDLVDAKEIELQLIVSQVIATQGPVATDLRRLASTLKIITNLERIADMTVNISKRVMELSDTVYMKRLVDIPRTCDLAQTLLKLAIQAFVHEDISRLREVVDLEDEIDALNMQIHHDCLAYMIDNTKNIHQGSVFIFVGSYLERIGDHATNIFETVFYIITGDYIDFNDLDEETIVRIIETQKKIEAAGKED
ncbi:phosphate signaling complex protein PhoU [Acetobacterium carbinolicum]|jgi:phosphate transport system regulatory protein PhoU|uniref:phosphate signaling complex protein PhoU n=1 Tax=Acetobacterium TaxID=33951 RepID=UPI000DBEC6A1|nr:MULTISPECIES: phosphate signaling complex protein PhoU [unclassified Acetobacterium]AWW26268.1 phosphate transport system regulatory protein PhoU [Acetobacterium sp. KB-1]MDK2940871.1 phosphate transport system protein [Acetobacterium sp.]MDZ5726301.1 phosphate signaling complex protein PhoU [Acetobacterium sp. K1/6]